MHKAKRLGVGPLHVIGDQQQRRASGQQRAPDRAEQPVPQLRLGQRVGCGHLTGQLGQQPGQLGQVGSAEPGQARGDPSRAKPRGGDPVRQRAFGGVCACFRGHHAGLQAQLVNQPRLADARLGKGLLELLDIQPQRFVRAPPERARPDLDQAICFRHGPAQVVQHLAQIRLRLVLTRAGPQQEGHALTRLRRGPVEQQVGEQRFGPGRVQRRELLAAEPEVHRSE